MTLTIPISEPASLDRALALLRAGEPIAFPTDTVYGVGAAALDAAAVVRLYTVKRRPITQAIPLLLAVDGAPEPRRLPTTLADRVGGEPRHLRAGARPWERVVVELQRG